MQSAMSYVGKDYEPVFRWAYYIGIAAVIVAFILLRPKPVPAPINAVAFGCYRTTSGPAILLDPNGLQIKQSGFPRIGFHLERLKTGIALTAEAPIQAEAAGDGYRYSMYYPGSGYYLDFVRIINGRRYGVFDESDLSQLIMLARDGVYLIYSKSDSILCKTEQR